MLLVAYNNSNNNVDDRAGWRDYVQFDEHTHTHARTPRYYRIVGQTCNDDGFWKLKCTVLLQQEKRIPGTLLFVVVGRQKTVLPHLWGDCFGSPNRQKQLLIPNTK